MFNVLYFVFGLGFTIALTVLVFILGLIVGSFLNVCIYRIPLKQEIAITRSHCMTCGHTLQWYELIPLFSWIFQGGKCRACKAKISAQYPIVEATNAILWMAIIVVRSLFTTSFAYETGSIVTMFADATLFCICTSVLIVITVIDERTQEIPPQLNIVIAVLGAIRLALDLVFKQGRWLEYVIGIFAVSLIFLFIVLVTKGRGMGMGDVKLMAAAGFLIGWKHALLAMMLGCILGSVIHIIRMKVDKSKEHVLAFGPYLSMGIYLTFLFGDQIINWYMGFFKH